MFYPRIGLCHNLGYTHHIVDIAHYPEECVLLAIPYKEPAQMGCNSVFTKWTYIL